MLHPLLLAPGGAVCTFNSTHLMRARARVQVIPIAARRTPRQKRQRVRGGTLPTAAALFTTCGCVYMRMLCAWG